MTYATLSQMLNELPQGPAHRRRHSVASWVARSSVLTASEIVIWIKRMRGVALGTRQRHSHRLNKAKSCEAGASLAIEPMAWKTAILNLSAVRNGRERADYAMPHRSEEHTSELQSLMRNSYAVFCLKKKNNTHTTTNKRIHIATQLTQL